MNIVDLIKSVAVVGTNVSNDIDVVGLTMKSADVKQNYIYFAIVGTKSNGNDYIAEVSKQGGIVVTDKPTSNTYKHILVSDVRLAMGVISANFYDNCYKYMKFVGVVGTNGKTTTSYILQQIISSVGLKTAVFGTLGCNICGNITDYGMTSPDPIVFHKLLKQAYCNGVEFVIIEVSAHAIFYNKMYPIICDYGIFTNVSQDHLDFFGDMKQYSDCKKSFFINKKCKKAIINIDDNVGKELAKQLQHNCITYTLKNNADYKAENLKNVANGSEFTILNHGNSINAKANILGEFNIYNILGAVAVARELDVSWEAITKKLANIDEIEGRFNVIQAKCKVIIDFAHTPDGLENLLKEAKKICAGRLIAVFGCGGNRDNKKRPIMGEIATRQCDLAVITSDNSRFEETNSIIADIVAGINVQFNNYYCEPSREKAIDYAISNACSSDVVVICGKGGENYMDELGIKRPYSDKKVVEEVLRRNQ